MKQETTINWIWQKQHDPKPTGRHETFSWEIAYQRSSEIRSRDSQGNMNWDKLKVKPTMTLNPILLPTRFQNPNHILWLLYDANWIYTFTCHWTSSWIESTSFFTYSHVYHRIANATKSFKNNIFDKWVSRITLA